MAKPVVAFHSLEDRKVKSFLYKHSGSAAKGSRHMPDNLSLNFEPSFNLIKRGIIKPSIDEVTLNPRARSARLRVAERTIAPPWFD